MIYLCGQAVKWSCICIRRRVSACLCDRLWQVWVWINLYILLIVVGGLTISWASADAAVTSWSAWTALELHLSLKLDLYFQARFKTILQQSLSDPQHALNVLLDKRLISWSIKWKAALRLSIIKAPQLPKSAMSSKSLETHNKADSVLCPALKPDWKASSISFLAKKELSWDKTAFSNIFEIQGSFEIGQ